MKKVTMKKVTKTKNVKRVRLSEITEMPQKIDVGYYINPTIFGQRVLFICEEDIWEVSDQGGLARRMTSGRGGFSHVQFSPDGKWLAVSASEEGPREIYLMPVDGGELKRLTFLNSNSIVRGWDKDQVLFSTRAFDPNQEDALATVPRAGGPATPLGWGQTTRRAVLDGGEFIIERNAGRNDAAHWKRYRGGTAGKFYRMNADGASSSRFLQKIKGNLSYPMWVNGRVYFLSDHEGVGNLYSVLKTGAGLKRHTHSKDYYVRNPSTDGKRIVFHKGADIFVFDPKKNEAEALDIRIHSQRTHKQPKMLSAMSHLESLSPHPLGHSVALTSRGQLVAAEVKAGSSVSLSAASSGKVRDRLGTWLDAKRLIFVTDQNEVDQVGIVSVATPQARTLLKADVGRVFELKPSPDGKSVVLANHRNELMVVDVKSGKGKLIWRETLGTVGEFAWSPDSKWISFIKWVNPRSQVVMVWNQRTGKSQSVAKEATGFRSPSWSADGKLLYVLGSHNFNPRYEPMRFSLFFEAMERPYCILLTKDSRSPLLGAMGPESAENTDNDSQEKGKKGKGAKKKVEVHFDFDGIEDRLVEIPVPEKNYVGLIAEPKGLILLSREIEGSRVLKSHERHRGMIAERFQFESEKVDLVCLGIEDFGLSNNGEWVLYSAGDRLRIRKVSEWMLDGKSEDADGVSAGWIRTDKLQLKIWLSGEWEQIFHETWRLQKQFFWEKDLGGIDWDAQKKKYLPLLKRVSMRSELSDLLWELIGELGVSHAYMMGGDLRFPPAHQVGALGAEFRWNSKMKGWGIQKVFSGYPWKEAESSPLSLSGASVGDVIVSVNRQPVQQGVLISEMLVGFAATNIELELLVGPKLGKSGVGKTRLSKPFRPGSKRTLRLKTLRDEFGLRYRDWVEKNRRVVAEKTAGRVGYIHIPDMGPDGYAEFFEQYLKEFDKDGLVIDVRFNGGGHVSALILSRLLQRRVGFDQTRWFGTAPYPGEAPAGPMVGLTNEFAGSDGDIFSHAFKLYRLGPLVGMRTWGGVIGIWPRHHLVDGGVTTQPEFAFWFEDVGWDVEGHGTVPDIEVDILPHEYVRGQDPQLLKAIETVLNEMKKRPPVRPKFGPVPKRAPLLDF